MLEPGVHDAQLLRAEATDTQYGERLRWVFRVPADSDDVDDMEMSVWSGFKTHDKTKAGMIIEGLGGIRPAKGERLNLKPLIGSWCRLVVVPGNGDFPRVDSVLPSKRVPTGEPLDGYTVK